MCGTFIGCLVLVGRSANHVHFSATLHFVLQILYSKTQSRRSSEASLTFALGKSFSCSEKCLKGSMFALCWLDLGQQRDCRVGSYWLRSVCPMLDENKKRAVAD